MMMDLSNKASFFTGNPILDSRADMTIETRRKIFAKFGDSFIAHCLLVHTLELRTITNLHDSLLFRGITDLRNKVELVRKALVTGCTQSVKANVLPYKNQLRRGTVVGSILRFPFFERHRFRRRRRRRRRRSSSSSHHAIHSGATNDTRRAVTSATEMRRDTRSDTEP
jgi:hypothetical protein